MENKELQEVVDVILQALLEMEERFNKKFDVIDKRFDSINGRFDNIDSKFDKLEEKFDGMLK